LGIASRSELKSAARVVDASARARAKQSDSSGHGICCLFAQLLEQGRVEDAEFSALELAGAGRDSMISNAGRACLDGSIPVPGPAARVGRRAGATAKCTSAWAAWQGHWIGGSPLYRQRGGGSRSEAPAPPHGVLPGSLEVAGRLFRETSTSLVRRCSGPSRAGVATIPKPRGPGRASDAKQAWMVAGSSSSATR
jgi:hypothetical protein